MQWESYKLPTACQISLPQYLLNAECYTAADGAAIRWLRVSPWQRWKPGSSCACENPPDVSQHSPGHQRGLPAL